MQRARVALGNQFRFLSVIFSCDKSHHPFCYYSHLMIWNGEKFSVLGNQLRKNVDESQNERDDIIKKLINFVSRHRNSLKQKFKNRRKKRV